MNRETFLTLPAVDVTKYYGKTFLRAKGKGIEDQFVFVYEVVEKPVRLSVTVDDKIRALDPKELDIDFELPECGLYNYQASVVSVLKRPRRQARKGVCSDTLRISYFHSDVLCYKQAKMFPRSFCFSSSSLADIFLKPVYPSLEKAKASLGKKGAIFIALDKKFVLSLGVWSEHPTLWYDVIPIGEVHNDLIEVRNDVFFQEVVDNFKNVNIVKCEKG